MSKDIDKHRSNVMLHLTYIREMVDANNDELKRLNGRVRQNEKDISWIKGIGGTFVFLVSAILAWLGVDK
tara:strand:+ start:7729 stop:7938 length:210 start_codon:yes stop_codon:yes gene_type:complete